MGSTRTPPFVYTVAIDNGFPTTYEVLNQPVVTELANGDRWSPQNYDLSVGGPTISFLNTILGRADFLYIVGDLFDFWFEYRRAIPKVNLKILFKLHQLVESGVRINYFAGNHDVWLGNYLQDEIGVHIIREPRDVRHNSLTFYVAHGDGVIKQDRKQRLLNRIFKNRFNIFLYRLIHPDIGIPRPHADVEIILPKRSE